MEIMNLQFLRYFILIFKFIPIRISLIDRSVKGLNWFFFLFFRLTSITHQNQWRSIKISIQYFSIKKHIYCIRKNNSDEKEAF